MNITIRKMTAHDQIDQWSIDGSFTVDSILVLSVSDRGVEYKVKEIPGYQKSYADEEDDEQWDASAYIDHPDRVIYLALADERTVGRIMLKKNWNQYAYVEDIQVDRAYRQYGIGRKLMEQAISWAKSGDMPGIMLETQSNNVRACKFYESCGFTIGGFDSFLYKGLDIKSNETAIFWYLLF